MNDQTAPAKQELVISYKEPENPSPELQVLLDKMHELHGHLVVAKAKRKRKSPYAGRTVYVRCDQNRKIWIECTTEGDPIREFTHGILTDVSLITVEKHAESGCGSISTGIACGLLRSNRGKVSVPNKVLRHLKFHPGDGRFYDPDSSDWVYSVSCLILGEGCLHSYIA